MAEAAESKKTSQSRCDAGTMMFRKMAGQPHYRDFVCGWGAACVETCVMYPLTKLIFRQQLHGVFVKEAIGQLRSEGAALLYRGLLPPLIMKTSSRAVMFGMYKEYQNLLGCHGSTFTAKHALAAFLSGSSEAMLCPLERVQTLLQSTAYHDQLRNTAHAMTVLRPYGLREFYRGWTPIVLRNGLSNILFFALRGPLRDKLGGRETGAASSSSSEGTQAASSSGEKTASSSSLKALSSSINAPSCSSPASSSLSSTTASSPTDRPSPSSSSSLAASPAMRGFLADFLCGALLGATISTIFYPLNVVKTRMMNTLGTEFVSMRRTFAIVWNERNRSTKELFRGVQLNYSRSVLAWGITNSVFEFLQRQLRSVDDDR